MDFSRRPRPPRCTAHGIPLGTCDECGSTVQLGIWTRSLGREELVVALFALLDGSRLYTRTEHDALVREAMGRLH